jgi:hypothetical protein
MVAAMLAGAAAPSRRKTTTWCSALVAATGMVQTKEVREGLSFGFLSTS